MPSWRLPIRAISAPTCGGAHRGPPIGIPGPRVSTHLLNHPSPPGSTHSSWRPWCPDQGATPVTSSGPGNGTNVRGCPEPAHQWTRRGDPFPARARMPSDADAPRSLARASGAGGARPWPGRAAGRTLRPTPMPVRSRWRRSTVATSLARVVPSCPCPRLHPLCPHFGTRSRMRHREAHRPRPRSAAATRAAAPASVRRPRRRQLRLAGVGPERRRGPERFGALVLGVVHAPSHWLPERGAGGWGTAGGTQTPRDVGSHPGTSHRRRPRDTQKTQHQLTDGPAPSRSPAPACRVTGQTIARDVPSRHRLLVGARWTRLPGTCRGSHQPEPR